MFLSNTRSIKGKTTELQESDIICPTEAHLDCTIPNGNVLLDHRTVFRRDRNIHGGGVLIAVGDQLNLKLVNIRRS